MKLSEKDKEDIKRCEKLIEPQNANWIGITNQLAIAHLIEKVKELRAMCEEYCPKTERIKELEENSIPKQKVKEIILKIINYKIARAVNNGYYYDYFVNQEYKEDFVKLFNKLLEDK